jgi:uncharacterized protein YkwD
VGSAIACGTGESSADSTADSTLAAHHKHGTSDAGPGTPDASTPSDAGYASDTATTPGDSGSTASFDAFQLHNLNTINSYRASLGIAPLVLDGSLDTFAMAASVQLSVDGVPHGYFNGAGGSIWNRGFIGAAGENQGTEPNLSSDPVQNELAQIDAALASMIGEGPGGLHYVNIMNPAYTRLGVGLYELHGTLYLTNDFSGGAVTSPGDAGQIDPGSDAGTAPPFDAGPFDAGSWDASSPFGIASVSVLSGTSLLIQFTRPAPGLDYITIGHAGEPFGYAMYAGNVILSPTSILTGVTGLTPGAGYWVSLDNGAQIPFTMMALPPTESVPPTVRGPVYLYECGTARSFLLWASDNIADDHADFFANGVYVGTESMPPQTATAITSPGVWDEFSFTVPTALRGTSASVYAVVYDHFGNSTSTTPVNVTITP